MSGSKAGVEQVREDLGRAEEGDVGAVEQVERAREVDPAGVEAVEQEAADGPEGQGVSR